MTTYAEVTEADRDVALFLVNNINRINIWRLPLKAWVARRDEKITAVLTFDNITYPSIHVIVAPDAGRPFVALLKLWYMALEWFASIDMPMICAPVFIHLHHFQSLLRRLGFVKVGEERDDDNRVTEIIYAYYLKGAPSEDSLRAAE